MNNSQTIWLFSYSSVDGYEYMERQVGRNNLDTVKYQYRLRMHLLLLVKYLNLQQESREYSQRNAFARNLRKNAHIEVLFTLLPRFYKVPSSLIWF